MCQETGGAGQPGKVEGAEDWDDEGNWIGEPAVPKPESGEEEWYENGTLDEFQEEEEEVWDEKPQAKETCGRSGMKSPRKRRRSRMTRSGMRFRRRTRSGMKSPKMTRSGMKGPRTTRSGMKSPNEVWDEKFQDEEVWDEKIQDEEVWDEKPQDEEVWDEKCQDEEVWDEKPPDEEIWEEAWYVWSNMHACLAHVFYCFAQEEDWPEDDEEAGVSHAKAKDLNSWCRFVYMAVRLMPLETIDNHLIFNSLSCGSNSTCLFRNWNQIYLSVFWPGRTSS